MTRDRTEYFKEYHHKWYLEVMVPRREKWFLENGPCVDCGSWENLELDHVNPDTKIHSAIWSWSDQRRSEELTKCQPRCYDCHKKKTIREGFERGIYGNRKKEIIDGKTWCKDCQAMIPVENFDKDKYAANGCYSVCKDCRRRLPSRAQKRVDEFLALVA